MVYTNQETGSASQNEVFVKMVISAWESQNTKVDKLLARLTDEQLLAEVAPGRNRGIYLLGHLIAVSDAIIPLIGLGEKRFPGLEKVFLESPDKSGKEEPSVSDLRKYWVEVNDFLAKGMKGMSPDEWFSKHSAVSETDFEKEPQRNKLNILINRAIHQGYHLGQMAFL